MLIPKYLIKACQYKNNLKQVNVVNLKGCYKIPIDANASISFGAMTTGVMSRKKQEMIDEHDAGKTQVQIAKGAECHPSMVSYALAQWGITTTEYELMERNKSRIVELYESGATQEKICREIGCNSGDIVRAFKRWDMWTIEEVIEQNKDRIIELFKLKVPFFEIGQEIGCSGKLIERALKTWGEIKSPVEQNKDLILELHNKKVPIKEIAQITKCEESVIRNALRGWGQKIEKELSLAEQNKDEIVRLYEEENLSQSKLASRYKCGVATIRKILQEAGIDTKANMTSKHGKQMLQLSKQGYNQEQIAQMLGCAQTTVSSVLAKLSEQERQKQKERTCRDTIFNAGEHSLDEMALIAGGGFFVIRKN